MVKWRRGGESVFVLLYTSSAWHLAWKGFEYAAVFNINNDRVAVTKTHCWKPLASSSDLVSQWPGNSGNNKPYKAVSDRLSLKYFSNFKAYQAVNLPSRALKMWLGTPFVLLCEYNRTAVVRGTIVNLLVERSESPSGAKNYWVLRLC